MKIIAVIPARGGSKGIKNKNIRIIAGHPLIAYSIKAGLSVKRVDRVICTTDSPEIAEIAKNYGAEVPFLRPKKLALDDTPDYPVFKHLLDYLKEEKYIPDIVLHLRPTSPVRFKQDIEKAIKIFINTSGADSLRTVCKSPLTPYKMWRKKGKYLKPILSLRSVREPYNMPRQKLPIVYWQTGYLDIFRYQSFRKYRSMTGKKILGYEISSEYAVDIDKEEDLERAEYLVKNTKCIKP